MRPVEHEWSVALPATFVAELDTLEQQALARELMPIAGMAELLATLREPRCVASSSAVARIRQSLAATDLSRYFDPNLFSASMVSRGKPAPDLFLHAARAMGHVPEECIVIEDSPFGVAAARAAGMRAIGFTGGTHSPFGHVRHLAEAGAETVVRHAGGLGSLLLP